MSDKPSKADNPLPELLTSADKQMTDIYRRYMAQYSPQSESPEAFMQQCRQYMDKLPTETCEDIRRLLLIDLDQAQRAIETKDVDLFRQAHGRIHGAYYKAGVSFPPDRAVEDFAIEQEKQTSQARRGGLGLGRREPNALLVAMIHQEFCGNGPAELCQKVVKELDRAWEDRDSDNNTGELEGRLDGEVLLFEVYRDNSGDARTYDIELSMKGGVDIHAKPRKPPSIKTIRRACRQYFNRLRAGSRS